ncbi:SUMF1/EgtB/PvdO family nonheme iron enzyme [Methylolobus aquaticus]
MIPLPGTDIAIGKYEVTRGQFARFVSETGHATHSNCSLWTGSKVSEVKGSWREPGFDQTDDHPVTCLDPREAVAYAAWLSDRTGHEYRLPTREEWLYACNAEKETAVSGQCDYDTAHDVSWGEYNSGQRTHPVGRKPGNYLGIFDMLGNVNEFATFDCSGLQESLRKLEEAGEIREAGKLVICASNLGGSWQGQTSVLSTSEEGKKLSGWNSDGFRLVRVR